MTDFKDKNVLITGAAGGIGRIMTKRMAELGANLHLWDINRDGLDSLSEELHGKTNQVHNYVLDISDRQAIYDTAKKVLDRCKYIDILINDAGIVSRRHKRVHRVWALWLRTVQVLWLLGRVYRRNRNHRKLGHYHTQPRDGFSHPGRF